MAGGDTLDASLTIPYSRTMDTAVQAFSELLDVAQTCGAVTGWRKEPGHYVIAAGSSIYKVAPGQAQGFLEGLIHRHETEQIFQALRSSGPNTIEKPLSS